MLLALALAAATLGTLALVCLPLLRNARDQVQRGDHDRAVYRDQLREVERDLARGVLSAAEADSARLEIQRRLLAVDALAPAKQSRTVRDPRLAAGIALLVVVGAAGLYMQLGAPWLPDAPASGRVAGNAAAVADNRPDMRDAAARLAEKLRADPSNAEGWLLYAQAESMLNDWQTAGDAYRRAIALGRRSADVFAAYGEMQVLEAGGIVPPAAHEAFNAALQADQKNAVARYYTALADSQAGEVKRAIDTWLALAADITAGSPMREAISRGVAQAAKAAGIAAPPLPAGPAPLPGPSDDQMAAAARMPEAQRNEMIRGMVAQLAARLRSEPDDVEGWLRLGRSYEVLDENDKSADAFEHALRLRPDDTGIQLATFEASVAGLRPTDPLPPRALALLRQLAAAEPDRPQVLWYLGMEAARSGHADEARQKWTRLLAALPPGSEDAKLVQGALTALPGREGQGAPPLGTPLRASP